MIFFHQYFTRIITIFHWAAHVLNLILWESGDNSLLLPHYYEGFDEVWVSSGHDWAVSVCVSYHLSTLVHCSSHSSSHNIWNLISWTPYLCLPHLSAFDSNHWLKGGAACNHQWYYQNVVTTVVLCLYDYVSLSCLHSKWRCRFQLRN